MSQKGLRFSTHWLYLGGRPCGQTGVSEPWDISGRAGFLGGGEGSKINIKLGTGCMPAIPVLQGLRQEGLEFEVSLCHRETKGRISKITASMLNSG
jgi:hypothetical protein